MNIKDIGGEFELIKRLTHDDITDNRVIKSVGDDCAVLDLNKEEYLLVTTDMLVEGDHFRTDWYTPLQIGMKAMEANISDIMAMAGQPTYAFVSMALTKNTSLEYIEEIYKGIKRSAKKYGIIILGGDTTHSDKIVFNITLLGQVKKTDLRLRSDAKKDELICVTGKLGGSTAGLKLLENNQKGYLLDHLEPKARKEAKIIGKYCSALIDVSDGLAPEIKHICEQSKTGSEIYFEKIPIDNTTKESARLLNMDPYDFALYGGEDFELVFTIPKDKIEKLKNEFTDFTIVGQILDKKEGIYILKDSKKLNPKKGFEHF